MIRRITVCLPGNSHRRLRAIARKTARTVSCHVRKAVAEHLEDIEDRHIAEAALLAYRRSGLSALSPDDLDAELGLKS